MSFLLDTDTCSKHMSGAPGLTHRFIQHSGRLAIPSIVLGELYAGAYLLNDPDPLLQKIADLLVFVDVIDFDSDSAEQFGKLRGFLQPRGLVVPPIDLLIASVAVANDLILITHNTSHFAPIPGLRLDDWLIP